MSTEPAAVISAGQLLRQAREQRQLSVQQVAVQLNLKPSQVEQLEQMVAILYFLQLHLLAAVKVVAVQ